MKSYHNTTPLAGVELQEAVKAAKGQDEKVLALFKTTGREHCPDDVLRLLNVRWPITSVRRSITNLTKGGKLKKTGNRVRGAYGAMVNTWVYKEPGQYKQLSMF